MRFAFFRKSAWWGVLIGLACAGLCWGLARVAFFRGLEEWVLDGFFSLRGPRPTAAKVVVIGLDEPLLEEELGKPLVFVSPELAEVVRYAAACGATSVGIDLIVPENVSDWPAIDRPGAEGDARSFGAAVREAGNVVLAQWHVGGRWRRPPYQWRLKHFLDPEPTDFGFVTLTHDEDQFVRRQQLLIRDEGEAGGTVPFFGLALLARARGEPFGWDSANGRVLLGGEAIPTDAEQKLRINYAGPPGTFPVTRFAELLAASREREAGFVAALGGGAAPCLRRGAVPAGYTRRLPELAGAVAIVGVTAADWQDYHPTPFNNLFASFAGGEPERRMSGPEVHAHLIATIADGAYVRSWGWLAPVSLLVFGPLLGVAAMRLNVPGALVLTVAYGAAWYFAAFAAFAWFGARVEVVPLILLGVVTCLLVFARRGLVLQRILRAVKSQAIAKALEADPGRLELGGENREVTVLFADIRGFTAFSERYRDDPQKVVALLNTYFTAIVPLIEREGGTLNQYMGDGIMVLFGAPRRQPDHALRAVRAAVAVVRCVHERAPTWEKLGFPGMRVGVGVNTGVVVAGSIGSPGRLDYSAIGDTTNTASRIEGKNKECGTEILISETTLRALPPGEARRLRIDEGKPIAIEVKGKEGTLKVYPVLVPGAGGKTQ